jgi:hypothetical protein
MSNFAPLQWAVQVFIAVDQLANVLVTPFHKGAWADETLSSRSYRAWKDGRVFGKVSMPLIDLLFFWQEVYPGAIGHCHGAYLKERARYNLPPELRS